MKGHGKGEGEAAYVDLVLFVTVLEMGEQSILGQLPETNKVVVVRHLHADGHGEGDGGSSLPAPLRLLSTTLPL